jgi:hypothetical protein
MEAKKMKSDDAKLDQIIRYQDYRAAIALLREAHKRMGNTAFPGLAHRIALFLSTAPSVPNGNDSSSASSSPKSAAVTPIKGTN